MPNCFTPASAKHAPWVLVSAGFHERGGQSKANAALADYLLECGHTVHLVGHDIDGRFLEHPGVRVHPVRQPLRSDLLGWMPLDWTGGRVARQTCLAEPATTVVVNGGCCSWGDVNWVHCVHHAWKCRDDGAPPWFRLKNRLTKAWARFRERQTVRRARFIVANSQQTRTHLIEQLQVDSRRVEVVYLGSDGGWQPPSITERSVERARVRIAYGKPLVLFAGALGFDNNKGLDTLLTAWVSLIKLGDWDADLLVAGDGNGLVKWRSQVDRLGLADRIHFLGFTSRMIETLAAVDLLVSPVRYEAYGMNVQEAICRGVPALVSARAGIVEQYPSDLGEMILSNPEDVTELAAKLRVWRENQFAWPARFRPLRESLRSWSWQRMAASFVALTTAQEHRGIGNRPPHSLAKEEHHCLSEVPS